MDLRRVTIVTAVALSSGCATPMPPPAAGRRPPKAAPAFSDLLDEESPVGYDPNARADTPECRALFADFNETWEQAHKCERDVDCAIAIGSCTAARVDFKPALDRKLAAVGPCVNFIAISRCLDTRAICFDARCRVRGRPDKGG